MNVLLHICTILFYFILMFLISSYNQNCLGILIMIYLGLLIIIIFIRRWFINYTQDQIIILRGVLDELDEIFSELPGDEGVRILLLHTHGRHADGHPPPFPSFFPLKIAKVYGIDYNIIIILELEAPIIIKQLVIDLLKIFLVESISQSFSI